LSTPAATWQQTRARLARRSQDLAADDPELEDMRRDLRAMRLEEHVAKIVADWPPLTDEQLDRVAALLRAGR
jgi:hypothetical protein